MSSRDCRFVLEIWQLQELGELLGLQLVRRQRALLNVDSMTYSRGLLPNPIKLKAHEHSLTA